MNSFYVALDPEGCSMSLSALVDSGSEENLIDEALAQQLGCSLIPLSHPIKVVNLGGSTFAKITHCTCPIHASCTGNPH